MGPMGFVTSRHEWHKELGVRSEPMKGKNMELIE